MEIWKNLDLNDLEGEEWIDVIGYDGVYHVSTFGRIKSIPREVRNGSGTRMTTERILKQNLQKRNGIPTSPLIMLSYNNIQKVFSVSRIVFSSFYPEEDIPHENCIMHEDKIVTNNKLSNLKKTSWETSRKTDMELSSFTQIAVEKNRKKADASVRLRIENRTNKTHTTCKKCGNEKGNSFFEKNRLICKECYNKNRKAGRDTYVFSGSKKCTKCEKIKDIKFFYKNYTYCRECGNKWKREYKSKHKANKI
jgi:hypothetical protein